MRDYDHQEHMRLFLLNPKNRIYSSHSPDFQKKVTCVINASTTTRSFIGDFMSDKVLDQITTPSLSSTSSPLFYKSTSSEHRMQSPTPFLETKQINITPISSTKTSKTLSLNSPISETSDYLVSALSAEKSYQRLSNTTTSETFGFLFALDKYHTLQNEDIERESSNILYLKHLQEFSRKYYSNVLLSINDQSMTKTNFDFQKTIPEQLFIVPAAGTIHLKPFTNRQLISIVCPPVLPFEHQSSGNELTTTDLLKLGTVSLDNKVTNTFEKYLESQLPSNAEGDTYNSYLDMSKIYPNINEYQLPEEPLIHFAYPKDVTPTQTCVTSDLTKKKSSTTPEILKPQKIFSQLHRNLNEVRCISTKSYKEIKNHSIETMKFFHRSLVLGEY